MNKHVDNLIWRKANGLSRLGIVSGLKPPGQLRPLVNEYPKSGGSWMAQLLSEALDLPFPRNRLPSLFDSVMHGHYRNRGIKVPVVSVYRDGRDVITSLYFHRLIKNSYSSNVHRDRAIKCMGIDDPLDVLENMPKFIEFVVSRKTHPYISWSDFVDSWYGSLEEICHVKYEDMLENSAKQLIGVCESIGVTLDVECADSICNRYTFDAQAKRNSGIEDTSSYLRKGIAGDWKEKFSLEARQIFDHYMGSGLLALGYESNNEWVIGSI